MPKRSEARLVPLKQVGLKMFGFPASNHHWHASISVLQQVARQTLVDRATGRRTNRHNAHSTCQLLSQAEENVLVEWLELMSTSATPLNTADLRGYALALTGKYPGKLWHRRFLERHPSLRLGKASGLDPKRAKNFNKANVSDYFEKRKKLNDKYDGIPPEQDWNMDEKGCQMGGGHKNNGRTYFFTHTQKDCYRLRSDNLKLATVIECVSAAGNAVPPTFVLSDGPLPDLRDLPDDSVGWYACFLFDLINC